MTSKRKAISKKLRFEVFKRDSFKCQYCGKCAPDVILNVDHINPVSKGGENDIMNLITACEDCNSGKSDRVLSDGSVMAKQRAQLEELNERREQLEQLLAWREGLQELDETGLKAAKAAWKSLAKGWGLNEKGDADLLRLIKKYGLRVALDSIDTAERYIVLKDGKATEESVNIAFKKLGGIARMKTEPDWKRELFYIRGIARNSFNYVNESECMRLLEAAYERGTSIDSLKAITRGARNWTGWCQDMNELL